MKEVDFFRWCNAKNTMPKRTTKDKDKNKKKGGALLGQGTYGCAYSPVIPCKSNEVFVDGTVGKVMSNERSANDEMNAAELIKEVDPKGVYTNSPLGRCDVARSKIMDMNPNTTCKHIKDADTYPQIVLPHKGVSLDAWREDMFTKDSFAGFVHLAKGLEMLAQNTLVHMDLKLANVIRKNDKKLIMIDFGISRGFSEEELGDFYSDGNQFLTNDYYVFPPDFHIYDAVTSALWLKVDEYHDWYDSIKTLSLAVVESWDVDMLVTFVTHMVTSKKMPLSLKEMKDVYERIGLTLDQFTNDIRTVVKRMLRDGIPRDYKTASDQTKWVQAEMSAYVDRVDVYGFGQIMLHHYLRSDVSKSATPFSHSCASIIRRCIHADPMYRYDAAGLVSALKSAYRLIGRAIPPLEPVSKQRVPARAPPIAASSPIAKRAKRAKRAVARTPVPMFRTPSARVAPSARTPRVKRGTV